MNPTVLTVAARIRERSETTRRAYLQRLDTMAARGPGVERMGCANVAHSFAAMQPMTN